MKFSKRLERVLNEALQAPGTKRYKIHHRSGKIIEADHVRKVRSPYGGRISLFVGINAKLGRKTAYRQHSILHKLRDFTKVVDLAERPKVDFATRSVIRQRNRGTNYGVIPLYEHILCIGLANITKVEDLQLTEQPSAPAANAESTPQQSTGI